MTNKTRKFADATRDKIIKAAVALFARQGFSGTAMQAIADRAGVNQALLYHHFKNKKNLWKLCKGALLDQVQCPVDLDARRGLRAVLTDIIEQRYQLYSNDKVVRMMLWQQLEPNQQGIMGGSAAAPDNWLDVLRQLQRHGQMRDDYSPEAVMCWISGSVTSIALGDRVYFKKDKTLQRQYISMLVDGFVSMLQV